MWFKALIIFVALIDAAISIESCSESDPVLVESTIGNLKGVCSIIDANSEKKKVN